MKKNIFVTILASSITATSAFGAALVVNFDSGGYSIQNSNSTALSGGAVGVAHDGSVVQLGYFTGATSDDNNFEGNFVPLTGHGSANFLDGSPFDTTIGDDPPDLGADTNGQFSLHVTFDTAFQTNFPSQGTILSIRVFDRVTSNDGTSKFMTASSNLWKWRTPGELTDPTKTLSLSFADGIVGDVRLENRLAAGGTRSTPNGSPLGASNPQATIPVPEPSSLLLFSVGALVSLKRRRS